VADGGQWMGCDNQLVVWDTLEDFFRYFLIYDDGQGEEKMDK
jgi:hypothetical protein